MKKFFVKPFNLYKTSQHYYFYRKDSSAKISATTYDLLHDIKKNYTYKITENQMQELFGRDQQTQQDGKFLIEELRIFDEWNSLRSRFESMYIISDNPVVSQQLAEEFGKGYDIKKIVEMDIDTLTEIDDSKVLVVIFQEYYQKERMHALFSLLANKPETQIINSYLINHYLILDNIYSPQSGHPCHFCNLEHVTNLGRSTNNAGLTTWQTFIQSTRNNGEEIIPATPLRNIEKNLVAYYLWQGVDKFINPHYYRVLFASDLNVYTVIDLISNEKIQKPASFAEQCECLCD